jgi:hypothetical protein
MVGLSAATVALLLFVAAWPRPEPVPAPPPVVSAPAISSMVTIAIETNPAGATVTRGDNGEVLGITPLKTLQTRSDKSLSVIIEAADHVAVTQDLSLSSDTRLQLELKPTARGLSARKRTEVKSPTTPARPARPQQIRDGVLDPFAN